MKKLAIAVMLLSASSAFGALMLQGAEGLPTGSADPGTSITLNLKSDIPIAGCGIALVADKPGLTVTAVTYPQEHWQSTAFPLPLPASMDPPGTSDLGGNSIVDTGANVNVVTFTIDLGTAAPGVYTISSVADTVYWYDAAGILFEVGDASPFTLTITPEPTSMLLLAAGSLLFARRRRA